MAGLDSYRRKRDFKRTPEPAGKHVSARPAFRFVVQKHAARRLHYDFRLELDGTLKSWAVPKGPSLDPRERRLAVRVEDHPVEYGKFEGVIPKHEYGAGSVIVWDRGTWRPEGDARGGYQKGHLRFRLDGEKLHGRWSLVRTHKTDGDKEHWFLIKADDEYASGIDIVEALPNSVQSGCGIDDVAAPRRPRAKTALPRLLRPQLAALVDAVPAGPEWVHEIKYDGYRVLCRLCRGRAKLYSRNGVDLTRRMAAVTRAVQTLSGFGDAWLDGEVVALKADGHTDFSALQAALSEKRDANLIYYLFDLPYVNGADLTGVPLLERKRRLAALLRTAKPNPQLRYSDHIEASGPAFYQQACGLGLEGIISKRADAPYRCARTRDWVKVKCRLRQEFVVGGYSDPGGTRRGLGALLLGVYDGGGRLVYCGRTGTGFTAAALEKMHAHLVRLQQREPPFGASLTHAARKGAHWVRPETVVEVEFTGWTRDGNVRQAAFRGVRKDKSPREVKRELPQPLAPTTTPATTVGPGPGGSSRAVRLTHADKVLYPEQGLTKADLADYYRAVAHWMMPYVARRPLTLMRCPEGRAKQCFFQKHATEALPGLRLVPLRENNGESEKNYFAADSVDGLLALVQMGVLEIHAWGARIDRPEQPDQLVFDLDPDPALPWPAVLEAAALVKARIDDLGLAGFLRTTGGKGLHVVVPLVRRLEWPAIKPFAKALADDVVRQDPRRYTTRLPIAARKGRVFIDYLRNGRGATAIASYSTRARPGATVAMPLTWKALTPELNPRDYTVLTVPRRLESLPRDPWADFNDARRPITRAMQRSMGAAD